MDAKDGLLAASCLFAVLMGVLLGRGLARNVTDTLRAKKLAERSGASSSALGWLLANGVAPLVPATRLLARQQVLGAWLTRLVNECAASGLVATVESVGSVVLLALLALCLVALAISGSVVCALALVGSAVLGLTLWLGRREEQRRNNLRESIPEALQTLKACFQTGYSLGQALGEVKDTARGPLQQLFAEAQGVIETGGSSERALRVLKEKGGESELVFLATALEIQHKTGSSMQRVLEATRQSVTDEIELKRTLRTQTAQAKLSAQIVTLMPFVLIGLFSLVSPGFLDPFFESPLGFALLAIALGMQVAGIALVRKMLKVGDV